MPASSPPRVLQDRSVRELMDYQTTLAAELRIHVYYMPEKQFIIAPLNGTKGLYVEEREVTVLAATIDDEFLGRTICDNLLWYLPVISQDLRNSTKQSWPAYVASGLKSARRFGSEAILIDVSTKNTALNVTARPYRINNEGDRFLGAVLPLAATHDRIGECVRVLLKGIKILQGSDFY